MAKNRSFPNGRQLSLVADNPASPVSGDPVRVGTLVGVALTDERSDGTTTIDFGGVYALSAKGIDNAGNSAIAVGDKLYYVDATTPKISKNNVTGTLAGYALQAVNAGATATIRVKIDRG